MTFIRLTKKGTERVLESQAGMTFLVDSFTGGANNKVAHVRDYRKDENGKGYTIWSIGQDGFELIDDGSAKINTKLLKMYDSLQNEVHDFYDNGSPAVETSVVEGKIEQMKSVLKTLRIPLQE